MPDPRSQAATPELFDGHLTSEQVAHELQERFDQPFDIVPFRQEAWNRELASIDQTSTKLDPDDWNWVAYPWRRVAFRVPGPATYRRVLHSRNFPIIAPEEEQILGKAHVILAGLSVGRSVAQLLSRLGIGTLTVVDADVIDLSNANRMIGVGVPDLGLPKAISVARELVELNPYADVRPIVDRLTPDSLEEMLGLSRADILVEMVDDGAAKVGLRRVAHAHDVPVVMATDIDWDPMVDVDMPGEPLFGGRLTDAELDALAQPNMDIAEKTPIMMRVIGVDPWPERSHLSGSLAAAGHVRYWSQIGATAAATGALAARVVFDILRGQQLRQPRVRLSLRDAVGSRDPLTSILQGLVDEQDR